MIDTEYEVTTFVNRQGIALETHENPTHTIKISYYTTFAAGPSTLPLYSCWVELPNGKKSRDLCVDENRHPLRNSETWDAIENFLNTNT